MNSYRQDPVRPAVKSSTENSDKKNKFAAIDHLSEEKSLEKVVLLTRKYSSKLPPNSRALCTDLGRGFCLLGKVHVVS